METKKNKMDNKKKALIISYTIGLISLVFSYGRFNIPILAWIWPACMLWYFRNTSKGFPVVFGSIILLLAQTPRYWGYSDGGVLADILIGIILGLLILIPLLLDRLFYPKLLKQIGAWAVLFAPLAFVSITLLADFITSTPQIGYSQSGNLPLMQVTAVIGINGLSFLLILFASILLYTLAQIQNNKNYKPAQIYLVILLTILILGGVRITLDETVGDSVFHMAYALSNYEGDFTDSSAYAPDLGESITFIQDKAIQAKGGGAELLCFAEEAFEFDDVDEPLFLQSVTQIAAEQHLWLLVPVDERDIDGNQGGKNENKEFLIDRTGNIVDVYYKVNLVPGDIEANNYVKGTNEMLYAEIPTVDGVNVKISSVICYDANNSGFVSTMNHDTDILIVPAWCWDGVDSYQANLMPFRAIENNIAIISPTVDAKSIASDWIGHIIAMSDEETLGRNGLNFVNVPVRKQSLRAPYHFYAKVLNWIYPLCLILLIIIALSKRKVAKRS